MRWLCVKLLELMSRRVRYFGCCSIQNVSLTSIDDLIKLHKSMVGTSSGANAALAQAVAAANEAMAKQEEFGREVRRFQQQIMHDLESSKTETKVYLGSLMKHIDSTLQGAVKLYVTKVKGIEREANEVEEVSSRCKICLYRYC